MTISELQKGSIDLHVHCAPDAYVERRVDALQLAQQAVESGMKHVVIKSHQFCTCSLAAMVNKIVDHPVLIGSLVLNVGAGGLNPEAVRVAAREGAKIIWLPTTSAKDDILAKAAGSIKASSKAHLHGDNKNERSLFPGISVLDDNGNLVPIMKEIMAVIQSNNLVLATGHVSIPEAIAVAEVALQQGVKTIITHPLTKMFGARFTIEQAKDLIKKGAFIEFCFTSCMPPMRMAPAEIIKCIENFGADHCLLTTDFGQMHNPPPTEGFRMMLSQMIRYGLSENELKTIVQTNPNKLLFEL